MMPQVHHFDQTAVYMANPSTRKTTMFGLFKKDPAKKLEKAYRAKLEEARDLQRSGDIKGYAVAMDEAETILKQLEAVRG